MEFDEAEISALVPDWDRERPHSFWSPSKKLLRTIRDYSDLHKKNILFKLIYKYFVVLRYRFWSVVCGADIPINTNIGGGLILQHPNGVVIHNKAVVGVNCLILQQVTIVEGVRVGGHVDIAAGAKIIRPVQIGEHAKIGANAVVMDDVPPFATVVGVPAKVVRIRPES